MVSVDYSRFEGFKDVYLEDSYVLELREDEGVVYFVLEAVLRESHPAYTPPQDGEQYCYRRGVMRFENVEEIRWDKSSEKMYALDGSCEVELGNIDALYEDGGWYYIEGDWGRFMLRAERPKLYLS